MRLAMVYFFSFFFLFLFVLVKSKTSLKQLQQKHSKNNTSYTWITNMEATKIIIIQIILKRKLREPMLYITYIQNPSHVRFAIRVACIHWEWLWVCLDLLSCPLWMKITTVISNFVMNYDVILLQFWKFRNLTAAVLKIMVVTLINYPYIENP